MNIKTSQNTLEEIQNTALQLYGRYNLEKSLIWFVEEVGELLAAIRKGKTIHEIEGELGDVFAWVLCLANILNIRVNDALDGTMEKEFSRQMKEYGYLKYQDQSQPIVHNDKLVIFDCDGVLVDSEYLIAKVEAEALSREGYPITPEEDVRRFSGKSQKSMLEMVEAELNRSLPSDFSEKLDEEVIQALAKELKPIANIESILEGIRYKCLASSSAPERIRNSLKITGIKRFFSEKHLFSTSEVQNGKPYPDIFIFAAGSMGFRPANCLVVEDSIAGVTAAAAAGMTVLGFTGGNHILDKKDHSVRLKEAGVLEVFDDMRELPDLIAKFSK